MNASLLAAGCLRLLFAFMLAGHARGSNRAEEAIVVLKATNASPVFFCAAYLPAVKNLPKKEEDAEYHPFLNALNDTECEYERRSFEGKVVLLDRCANTTNDQLIEQAKSAKAAAIVVSIDAKKVDSETRTNIKKLDIVVAFVSNTSARKISRYEQKHNESALMAKLIATSSSFDGSFFAIWIIAMGTVMTGSYWSGVSQHAAYAPKSSPKSEKKPSRASRAKEKTAGEDDANPTSSTSLVPGGDKHSDFSETIGELEEEFSMPLSPKLVVMFVIHMSVMLLTLYYFYRYLIYLIIIMFSLASASALFACLEPIVNRIGIGTSQVPERLAVCSPEPLEIRHVALAVFAIGVALTWYLFRNNDVFGWALQDILAIAFCINMLKSIHLPNLRMICLLLSLLLVYDVFFVFITPFLQANRESVMVEVAKGGNLKEALPVVVRFPKLVRAKFQVCVASKFSILGLGDILAPGLLLSYCHTFDLLSLGRRFYFYITCAAYGVGMVVTFVALHLMRNAQPALLYLVPCTILPTVLAAWYRGELFHIWNGLRLHSTAASSAAEAGSKASKPAPPNNKSPDNSEIELDSPGEEDAPEAPRKRRGNKRSRSMSQGPPKSAVRGGAAIETVVAEGDINGATTCDAFFIDVAERLMMPSPSALPPYSRKPMRAGGENADAVIQDVRRTSAVYKWDEGVLNGCCGSLGGMKTGDVDILPESSALFPA
ncbi:signal peptide peptidase-like 2B [Haemaphysalis longicornis]